jgi:cob(I)alamin adenosyltransferase
MHAVECTAKYCYRLSSCACLYSNELIWRRSFVLTCGAASSAAAFVFCVWLRR